MMFLIIQKSRLGRLPVKNLIKNYSSQPAMSEKRNYEEQIKEFERISNIAQKRRIKKPQKPPFVKNLLLGKFDTDFLTYPELKNEELNYLESELKEGQRVLQQPNIKQGTVLSKDFLKQLSQVKLLGLQTSQLIGGRELNATETCRFFEAISEVSLKNLLISNECLGVQILLKYGSDYLKKKYLERITSGESSTAFCVLEPKSSHLDVFNKTASLSPDKKFWILNGQRHMVINGSSADLFIVIANTSFISKDEIKEQKFTAFLVERDFGGVTSAKQKAVDEHFELSNVDFDGTQIPSDNVIGVPELAETILSGIYPTYRLSTGPICSTLTKNLINGVTDYLLKKSQGTNLLHEMDAVRSVTGELTTSLYAIESMVYFTAGLMDNYENQDCELESTIVKVFASEQTLLNTSKCLELIGPEGSLENHWCSRLHRDALCQVNGNDSNDNLKVLIALFGIRYAGDHMNDVVKKLRNPLFFALFTLKRMWAHRRQASDNPKLNLYLHHFLHPSIISAANRLEYCVLRLQYATEIFLARYGREVLNQHMELKRLAESIIDIYAMTACISRASRSYCIGLQHCEYEMILATAFSVSATERVKQNLLKIINGPYQTNDENYRVISERLFRFKNYYPVHPLTRNF